MKKYNNSQSRDNRGDNSQKPTRSSKPTSDTAKSGRQSFSRTKTDATQGGFSKKPVTKTNSTKDLGERPAFKRRSSTADESKPYARKRTFSDRAKPEENFTERRSPRGKGAPTKRTYNNKESDDTERKPLTSRETKPFGEKRVSSDDTRRPVNEKPTFSDNKRRSPEDRRKPFGEKRNFSGEKPASFGNKRNSFGGKRNTDEVSDRRVRSGDSPREKRDFTESGSKSFKRTSTDERPQKRTEREGYYSDKRKSFPSSTATSKQAPEYNLKKYDDKKVRGKQEKAEKDDTTRLNRYISNAGICSRREADKLIESGEIKVNGKVVTEMGYQVAANDIVKYGNRVLNKEKLVYVLLNKPKGYITTTDDPEERKTVMDLVGNACEQRIYPVGRLDRNTSGLLLFTNDGELAEKLAHPSNDIKKLYQVELDKPITKEDFQRVIDGVQLEDGLANVDDVAIVTPDKLTLGIEIHIGRNRIVRRIFEHLGYEVVKLDRVTYAGLTKKDLPRGNWRFLSEKEVIKLKYFV